MDQHKLITLAIIALNCFCFVGVIALLGGAFDLKQTEEESQ